MALTYYILIKFRNVMHQEDPLRPVTVAKGDGALTETGDGVVNGVGASIVAGSADAAGGVAVSDAEAERVNTKARVKNVKVRHMLEMLCSEAGFLIEPSVRRELESMEHEERSILEADSILKALNVDTEDEVNRMLTYFFTPVSEEVTSVHDSFLP